MTYAGIDLHKKYSYITVVDQEGTRLQQDKVINRPELLKAYFDKLDQRPKAVIEATFAWGWMSDLLMEQGMEVTLAHPLKVKAIASSRIKTDKIDSEVLADLHRANLIPPAYLATKKEREQRDLLRMRCSLVNVRSSIKRRVHAVLHKHNLQPPEKNEHGKKYTDMFGKSGRQWLLEVIKDRQEIPEEYTSLELEEYLGTIDELTARIERVSKQIKQVATVNPTAKFLWKLPGIGYFTALTLTAELGDINRFYCAGAVCSYAGLVASTYRSGAKVRHGRIKPGNKYIRWVLLQAVPKAIKKDTRLNQFYQRLAKKKGKPKAKVAAARKMLAQIYYSLQNGQYFYTDRGSPGFFSGTQGSR